MSQTFDQGLFICGVYALVAFSLAGTCLACVVSIAAHRRAGKSGLIKMGVPLGIAGAIAFAVAGAFWVAAGALPWWAAVGLVVLMFWFGIAWDRAYDGSFEWIVDRIRSHSKRRTPE